MVIKLEMQPCKQCRVGERIKLLTDERHIQAGQHRVRKRIVGQRRAKGDEEVTARRGKGYVGRKPQAQTISDRDWRRLRNLPRNHPEVQVDGDKRIRPGQHQRRL